MRVIINGLELSRHPYLLRSPIKGINTLPIRTASGNYSGRDGGYVSQQFYASREIVLEGSVYEADKIGNEPLLGDLRNALRIREELPLYLIMDSGETYFTKVYVTDINQDFTDKIEQRFQISLIAPDIYFYKTNPDDPEYGWETTEIETIEGGGYIFPYVLPVDWQPSAQPTIVNNPTANFLPMQIVLEGKYTNPRINNLTTGQFIQINATTTAGDVIVIDTGERTVTLNGGSILPAKSGDWLQLQPGDNTFDIVTDSGTDDHVGVIRYRIGYLGAF